MPRNSSVNFYLKKRPSKDGLNSIYLQFRYSGKTLTYFFGQKIKLSSWDSEKQRVINTQQTTADGRYRLNDLFKALTQTLEASFRLQLSSGIPTVKSLRKSLDEFLYKHHDTNQQGDIYALIERFKNGEIKFKGKSLSPNTLKTYKAVELHLREFELQKKYKLSFDSITLDFFYKYIAFLDQDLKLKKNTIAKDIRVIKRFMGEAVDLKLTINQEYKSSKFSYTEEDVDAVYLSDDEIELLYRFDLSNEKKLERVRDLFVFACHVGLRFSDFNAIKQENLITYKNTYQLKVNPKKVKGVTYIPCNRTVLEIFEKYKENSNRLPKSISSDKFNDYIKQACLKAGLLEVGRNMDYPEKPLWSCVGSHTARRSFATNLYLAGFPSYDIMKITAHKTEKSFLKYIKVSKINAAERLSKFWEERWKERISKFEVEKTQH